MYREPGEIIWNTLPNCVPEYYRSLREDEDHQYELRMQREERYAANREKIKAAIASDLPILDYDGYAPCQDCKDADYDTMTDEEDDFGRVICHNPACPLHEAHQAGEVSE